MPTTAGVRLYWLSFVALLIPLALGGYLALAMTGVNAAPGETGLAAESLLATGTIANPYALPTGPTAHVSPLHVGLVAAVYGLLGPNSPSARLALSLLCLACYLLGSIAGFVFCRRARLGVAAQAAAVLLTCVLPFQLYLAVISLRQWDQPFAALILIGSLLVASDPALARRPRYWPEAALAGLTGLAGTVSPSALPTLLLTLALVLWTRTRLRDARTMLLSALVVGAMVVPWGLRNQVELGHFILTRSNFGLELAIGNRDAATGRSDVVATMHPHDSPAAAERVASIGEVAYMAEMSAAAKGWIVTHPAAFAHLTLIRLRLLFLPDGSILGWDPIFGARGAGLLLTGFAVLRLLALAIVVVRWRQPVLWLAHCALPLAPYALTHVNARYEFPIMFTSVCLICTGVDLCLRSRSRPVATVAATRC